MNAKIEHLIQWSIMRIFLPIMKKTEFILINIFRPTFVPNLVTLPWKMSPGMPKEAGSLNGPLCAYLMRQIIELVQDLRAMNVLDTFQNDP